MILAKEIKEKLAKHYAAPEFVEYALQTFAEAVQGKKLVYLYRTLWHSQRKTDGQRVRMQILRLQRMVRSGLPALQSPRSP